MKPDYKNWVPKGMVAGVLAGTAVTLALLIFVMEGPVFSGRAKIVAATVCGALFGMMVVVSVYFINWHTTFSYNGKKQFSRRIIEKVASYVVLPENGTGLDVGCGSGALTIACAKNNPGASMVGLDRWGREYASFNQPLCERNAQAEGVEKIVKFVRGDACKLPYADETFDAVTSNYCYHNIPSRDRQEIILETLRVLKKGGTFAIHDIFSKGKYGDMEKLLKKLRDMGYEKVELLDTTSGLFMTKKETYDLLLNGSALLVGKK